MVMSEPPIDASFSNDIVINNDLNNNKNYDSRQSVVWVGSVYYYNEFLADDTSILSNGIVWLIFKWWYWRHIIYGINFSTAILLLWIVLDDDTAIISNGIYCFDLNLVLWNELDDNKAIVSN